MTFFKPLGDIPTEAIHPNALLVAYRGSVAHGMHVAGADGIDDIDLMGVFAAKANHYIGFARHSPETVERTHGQWDAVYYELRHFIRLLAKSNPNVLTMLWLKPEAILVDSAAAAGLRAHRAMFATKAAYHAFTGFAHSQLKRMENFDGPARQRMRHLEEEMYRRQLSLDIRPEQLTPLQARNRNVSTGLSFETASGEELVRMYREMRSKYTSGYQGQKRRELVERFGYDTKNAAHTLRILRMGIEFLSTGELIVDRRDAGDAEEFLSVKRGEWTLADVKTKANDMFLAARAAKEANSLPAEPDLDAIEQLCMSLVRATVVL